VSSRYSMREKQASLFLQVERGGIVPVFARHRGTNLLFGTTATGKRGGKTLSKLLYGGSVRGGGDKEMFNHSLYEQTKKRGSSAITINESRGGRGEDYDYSEGRGEGMEFFLSSRKN